MRLRSSQFVFLLLLACSVQNPRVYALNLMAGTALERTASQGQHRESTAAADRRNFSACLPIVLPAPETGLDAASLAAHSTPWSMRRPALQSAAVASFTGFLRA